MIEIYNRYYIYPFGRIYGFLDADLDWLARPKSRRYHLAPNSRGAFPWSLEIYQRFFNVRMTSLIFPVIGVGFTTAQFVNVPTFDWHWWLQYFWRRANIVRILGRHPWQRWRQVATKQLCMILIRVLTTKFHVRILGNLKLLQYSTSNQLNETRINDINFIIFPSSYDYY